MTDGQGKPLLRLGAQVYAPFESYFAIQRRIATARAQLTQIQICQAFPWLFYQAIMHETRTAHRCM
jgi:hypothetical protein